MCGKVSAGLLGLIAASIHASGALAAELKFSQISLPKLAEQVTESGAHSAEWQPEIEGLIRYSLTFPTRSIEQALKYQDTSALYYLSRESDPGLGLIAPKNGTFDISYRGNAFQASYVQPFSEALSYHVGVNAENETASPIIGGHWRNISGHRQLDRIKAGLTGSSADLSWTRTALQSNENAERIYALSASENELQASFGTRWFDLFQKTDVLAEVSLNDQDLRLGAQLEHPFGSANGYVGISSTLSSGQSDVVMGLRYALGENIKVNANDGPGLLSGAAPSLKALRRAALPRLWRENISLESSAQQAGRGPKFVFPTFEPSLACVIGCYDTEVDPTQITLGNFGLPGLIDLPTAQRLPDGELVLTQQVHEALARSGMSFQILPRLGVAFRYTGHGINGDEANGRVNHDRSFDAHLNLLEETKYMPSLALGLRDFIGTGWYSSEYLVGTKTFQNFEFTGGLGFGRLAGRNQLENPLSVFSERFETRDANAVGRGGTLGTINWFQGPAAPFGGVVYRYNDDLRFAAEYSSDVMRSESRYLDVNSPWNFGAQYRLNNTVSLSAQYLHGSTVSLGANIQLNPKRPPNGTGRETAPVPMRQRDGTLRIAQTDRDTLQTVLKVDGFDVLNFAEYPDYVRVDLRNTRYRSYAQALGRASATLQRFTSDNIKRAVVVFHKNGLEVSSYNIDLERISNEQVRGSTQIGDYGSIADHDVSPLPFDLEPSSKFSYGFGPYFTHRLFNPDLPLSVETGAEIGAKYRFSQNLSLSGSVRKSVLTTLTENKRLGKPGPLPKVQSDWGRYDLAGQDGHINNLKISYIDRLSPNLFFRAHLGYLETMYAGVGGEVLFKPKSSSFALGFDMHRVRQRAFDMRFDLRDYETTVGKVSLYYDDGGPFDLEINAGRYLAGDWGATTKISRRFANGWEVGAYATLTDVPFEDFGEGSFDKGIYVTLPLDWLKGSPSMSRRSFTIRPITGDGGATLASGRQLYNLIRNAQEANVKREVGRLWK